MGSLTLLKDISFPFTGQLIVIVSVNLEGKYFEALVKTGDKVQVGTPVLKANLEEIKKAGYEIVTPVIITNSADYKDVITGEEGNMERTKSMIKIVC